MRKELKPFVLAQNGWNIFTNSFIENDMFALKIEYLLMYVYKISEKLTETLKLRTEIQNSKIQSLALSNYPNWIEPLDPN